MVSLSTVCSKNGRDGQAACVIPKDTVEAIAIGAKALKAKCRKIASCAKIIPANGAPKPADIAAAIPAPIKTSVEKFSETFVFTHEPIVAPRWTSGPY
ncbi:Uncharacterised protein [marine metagenome]